MALNDFFDGLPENLVFDGGFARPSVTEEITPNRVVYVHDQVKPIIHDPLALAMAAENQTAYVNGDDNWSFTRRELVNYASAIAQEFTRNITLGDNDICLIADVQLTY